MLGIPRSGQHTTPSRIQRFSYRQNVHPYRRIKTLTLSPSIPNRRRRNWYRGFLAQCPHTRSASDRRTSLSTENLRELAVACKVSATGATARVNDHSSICESDNSDLRANVNLFKPLDEQLVMYIVYLMYFLSMETRRRATS